ncbi:MAG: efflux RND transporter permease subunit [Armatimonadetes bacterium]|nr:efflux RND transporter permease subunit [Armatimonadota bacterium]
MSEERRPQGLAGRLAAASIHSRLTPLFILISLLLGTGATMILPREEEPQITVPMADVLVSMPGANAEEVEQRVTFPMEKLIRELPGVEYVYSTTRPGQSLVIVRFYVGTPPEEAIVRLYHKLYANFDRIPPGVSQPLIKSRSIDDVPILTLTLTSPRASGFELRQLAAQLDEQIRQVDDVSETTLIGGQRRELRIDLQPERLAAYGLSPAALAASLQAHNSSNQSGAFDRENTNYRVQTGSFFRDREDLAATVVAVRHGRPVRLGDVARISDGPEEPSTYVFSARGAAAEGEARIGSDQEAVTLAIAKRRGANAIQVAEAVLAKVRLLERRYLPGDVELLVTRNYGETAAERSNELLVHMGIAVVSVTVLIGLALGRRESMVVAVAIPVTLALTLATFVLYGFTLNRVTFFALIFSIGILVDDAIVVVENVVRHLRMPENRDRDRAAVIVEAVEEVGNPTILATMTVVAAILPMAFVQGLMGPYMRPIPLGASAAMLFSMVVAFTVVPWSAYRILPAALHHGESSREDFVTRGYRRVMHPLIHHRRWRMLFLAGTVLLLLGSFSLVGFKLVVLKMLPFDNKSEFQVLVNMPEGTTLEQTARVVRALGRQIALVPEVTNYQSYVGTSSPYNFNGLVRHYFLRSGPNVADLQVNLAPKAERSRQSHEVAKSVRPLLEKIAAGYGAKLQVTEIPPGPPVLQTLVTEVYGPTRPGREALARQVRDLYRATPGVVDVDWYMEGPQRELRIQIDAEKGALSGIRPDEITRVLDTALRGEAVGLLHDPRSREDVPLRLAFERTSRSGIDALRSIRLPDAAGELVPLSSLVTVSEETAETSIYHKNLMPVVYIIGDVSGGLDSPLYNMFAMGPEIARLRAPDGGPVTACYVRQPAETEHYSIKWDGEWQVTYEVFRDLGIAFAVVTLLIYALIVGWFENFSTPLVILSAVPFSLVGILPGHVVLGSFFTATSMIGFIAGAGIVVRNSIILVDFIELRLREGMPLDQAVIDAGAVRFRPMMLTALAVIVGSAVILADPIFNGLAIALMAGEVASLVLSRTAVPVLYHWMWDRRRRL